MGPVPGINGIMNFILKPWQLFLLILSGWINHRQQEIIEFQNAQIKPCWTRWAGNGFS
jgi:hypothetical protein